MPTLVDKPNIQSNNASPQQNTQSNWHSSISSEYTRTYNSYSGHDMVAIFEIPLEKGSITHVVGELQTISYSMYNEKMPVRVLGDMNMKGVVFGNRTVAGSMVFTVFDRHWAHKMMDEYLERVGSNAHILTDELPPINITISMVNEYGNKSRLAIYGVTFVMEGQTMSIQDMYTENTFQYMAKDLDYLTVNVNINGGTKNKHDNLNDAKKSIDNDKETPIDLSDKDEEKKKEEAELETLAPQYKDRFKLKPDLIAKGRNYCLALLDERLRIEGNDLLERYQGGEITQAQYNEWYASLKKEWQEGRKNADEKFDE